MLTIDSKELDINYSGFSERKIKFIKETFISFNDFNASQLDSNIIIDGSQYGKSEYEFYVYKCLDSKNFCHVQVFKKINNVLLFGIMIVNDKEKKQKEYLVYHSSMSKDYDDEI